MASTGYEHMSDVQFWAEVGELLQLTDVGGLADYVHEEARRRVPDLRGNFDRRTALVQAAWDREGFDPVTSLAADAPFTPAEEAEFERLVSEYSALLITLAYPGGHDARADRS